MRFHAVLYAKLGRFWRVHLLAVVTAISSLAAFVAFLVPFFWTPHRFVALYDTSSQIEYMIGSSNLIIRRFTWPPNMFPPGRWQWIEGDVLSWSGPYIFRLPLIVPLLVSAVVLGATIRRLIRREAGLDVGLCASCRYPLLEGGSDRCSECGARVR